MIFSTSITAQIPEYDNITVEENEDGELMLILNPDQYTSLWDHVEDLEYKLKVTEAKLTQAEKELEKAYNTKEKAMDLTGIALSATALLAIIGALSQ